MLIYYSVTNPVLDTIKRYAYPFQSIKIIIIISEAVFFKPENSEHTQETNIPSNRNRYLIIVNIEFRYIYSDIIEVNDTNVPSNRNRYLVIVNIELDTS